MIRLTTILSEQSKPKVVFVSGLTRYESVAQQAARIQRNMPQYHVVPFKYTQTQDIINYLENDKPAALILYSRSVSDTKTYAAHISPTKIYAIEPYKPASLRGIPASNMWRHPSKDFRGAGISGNDTPKGATHVTALTAIAPLIAARIQV
tara:strand:- start:359 stop:808 length:450 start_codon:yes stop_codon:yes gene_type:complete